MPFSKNPAFNLKVVLQETGIAADTLRAWERRYGLPLPQRTAGGHRLYSQYDIETIKWLIARQADGLSISRAVDAWKEKISSGTDPLADVAYQTKTVASSNVSLDSLRFQWLEACFNFNEREAEQILNQAFAIYPVESVCTELLQRGLSEVGAQWYENQATVQQEHFTSALAMRRLDALLSASPAPSRNKTILVGCPANEWHSFTPLLISLFLRRRGLNVIYLGANVPISKFATTVDIVHPDLIVLIAQQLITAATLMETAHILSELKIPVAFGGRIFNVQPDIIQTIPAHYLGGNVDEAINRIEELLTTDSLEGPKVNANSQDDASTVRAFQTRRPQIEAALSETVNSLGFDHETMNSATEFLGDNISAALRLGNITLVDAEIEWVRSLLTAQHVPANALKEYINLYAEAVRTNLNGSGKQIVDWLNSQT